MVSIDACEVRYHIQGAAGHTGRARGRGEQGGGGGRERGPGGGRGELETTEGQVYEEMEVGRSQCLYENVAM